MQNRRKMDEKQSIAVNAKPGFCRPIWGCSNERIQHLESNESVRFMNAHIKSNMNRVS